MSYSPQNGGYVFLNFLDLHTPPVADDLVLEFRPPPVGTIYLNSVNDDDQFGTFSIRNRNQDAFVYAIAPPSLSPITLEPFLHVASVSGIAPPAPTYPVVTHFIQSIDFAGRSPAFTGIGRFELSHHDRDVYLGPSLTGALGAIAVAANRTFSVDSVDSSAFGEFEIAWNVVKIYPNPITSEQFGHITIANKVQPISLASISPVDISYFEILNKTQQIVIGPYLDNVAPTLESGYYPWMSNVNREISPQGLHSQKFGYIDLYHANNGLQPNGVEPAGLGSPTISHLHRTVALVGVDSGAFGDYLHLRNTMREISVESIAPPDISDVSVANLNRSIAVFSIGDYELGTPVVSDMIRTIRVSGIDLGRCAEVDVQLHTRYVSVEGIDSYIPAAVHVYTQHNVIAPKSIVGVENLGYPTLLNKNRALPLQGLNSEEFGRFTVESLFRSIAVDGIAPIDPQTFVLGDLHRTVPIVGIPPVPLPTTHFISFLIPPPPAVQRVWMGSVEGSPPSPVAVRHNRVELLSAGEGSLGAISIRLNSFTLEGISTPVNVGAISLNAPIYFAVKGIDSFLSGWPRVSPHTIYLPSADRATSQAKENHPTSGALLPVDEELLGPNGHPWFGHITVTHQHRSIGVSGVRPPALSDVALSNQDVVVYLPGIKSQRIGIFEVMGGVREISPNGIDGFEAGAVAIQHVTPYNDAISVDGIAPVGLSAPSITNQHRSISVAGVASFISGAPLVTHLPVQASVAGIAPMPLSLNKVELKDRAISVGSVAMVDDISAYYAPMRLYHASKTVQGVGISSEAVGSITLEPLHRNIVVNSVTSLKLGDFLVKGNSLISVDGIDSARFGDIQRWEFGTISLQGLDFSQCGRITMAPVVSVSSIAPPEASDIAIMPSVTLDGVADGATGGFVMVHPSGCYNRAIVVSSVTAGELGSVEVTA